jgi:Gas vesicle synthesis protein GvpL/GvpF
VVDRRAPLAVAAKSEAPGTADMAVNAAFLVESARIDDFSAEVARLTEDVGERMRVRYVGPMPAYSFADAEISAGSPAWA